MAYMNWAIDRLFDIVIEADPGEHVGEFARRLLEKASTEFQAIKGIHNGRVIIAKPGDSQGQLLAQWDGQCPSDEPSKEPAAVTDDTLKPEVSRLAETIFRRIEFDGSLHKSSLEDELYRWAKEMLRPTIVETTGFVATAEYEKLLRDDTAWAETVKKMKLEDARAIYEQRQKENDLRRAIYGAAFDSAITGTGFLRTGPTGAVTHLPATQMHVESTSFGSIYNPCVISQKVFEESADELTMVGSNLWADNHGLYYRVAE